MDQIAHLTRAFHSMQGIEQYDYLPFWERLFVDPPSYSAPLVALGAVVLLLMLPVARRFDRCRNAVGVLVGMASVVNMVHTMANLWFSYRGRDHIGFYDLVGGTINFLPGFAISTVVLFLVISTWRWGERVADAPSPSEAEKFGSPRAPDDDDPGKYLDVK